jgi:ribosomal protein S18 acetylase RimI-like enzyme
MIQHMSPLHVRTVERESELDEAILADATALFREHVLAGAALGWVEPPPRAEVEDLLVGVVRGFRAGGGCLVLAHQRGILAGLGYWTRYSRPTHRPHADLEKLATDPRHQHQGIGREVTERLIAEARSSEVEQLTLDLRADNLAALRLYSSLGFSEYGRLPEFVAVGKRRFDKILMVLDLRIGEEPGPGPVLGTRKHRPLVGPPPRPTPRPPVADRG